MADTERAKMLRGERYLAGDPEPVLGGVLAVGNPCRVVRPLDGKPSGPPHSQ